MLHLERYQPHHRELWNGFVAEAKNATLLHHRDYMEYHADRFVDHSLLVFDQQRLVALLPANVVGHTLYSHQGLTYGGLLLSTKATAQLVLSIFELLVQSLRREGIERLVYKCVPHIYHTYPSEEDSYALFRLGAQLVARNLSTTVPMSCAIRFAELRRRGARKALKQGLRVEDTLDFAPFWALLTETLNSRYGVDPVHTLAEIELLHSRFPNQIKLYTTLSPDGETLAGSLLYLSPQVVHAQYISASPTGKASGALDLLFDHLIHQQPIARAYFDFGHSTEQQGHYLNEGLIAQKEGFAGRGVVYDIYELNL